MYQHTYQGKVDFTHPARGTQKAKSPIQVTVNYNDYYSHPNINIKDIIINEEGLLVFLCSEYIDESLKMDYQVTYDDGLIVTKTRPSIMDKDSSISIIELNPTVNSRHIASLIVDVNEY